MRLKQKIFINIFIGIKHLFDFSDYQQDSGFFYPVNKKVIDKTQDKIK